MRKSLTEEELDSSGLYVDGAKSDENYIWQSAIGGDESYSIIVHCRNTRTPGIAYIVELSDGFTAEYLAADGLTEALTIAAEFAPLITAHLLTEVTAWSKQLGYKGGFRVFDCRDYDVKLDAS
jgi:hypothetical protein